MALGPAVSSRPYPGSNAENECCSWAAWSVEREDGVLVMSARSQDDGVPTLHSMFTNLKAGV